MFSFPEACWRGDKSLLGSGILWNLLFFFLMPWLIALMGSLLGGRGGWSVEGVALFSYAVIVVEEG
jgi:hypothetical protein